MLCAINALAVVLHPHRPLRFIPHRTGQRFGQVLPLQLIKPAVFAVME
jgi:hypothetical protein